VGRRPVAEQAGRRQGRQHADAAKFRDYFDYAEPIRTVPSHRALAVFRGRTLEWLDAKLVLDEEPVPGKPGLAEGRIAQASGLEPRSTGRRADPQDHRLDLEGQAQPEPGARPLLAACAKQPRAVAIKVFADNLRDLLLAAPAGKRVVMGLDPGIRTGVKVAVVSDTGKVLDTATVYPHEPRWTGKVRCTRWAAWWPRMA
jgi:uncharacterized protein